MLAWNEMSWCCGLSFTHGLLWLSKMIAKKSTRDEGFLAFLSRFESAGVSQKITYTSWAFFHSHEKNSQTSKNIKNDLVPCMSTNKSWLLFSSCARHLILFLPGFLSLQWPQRGLPKAAYEVQSHLSSVEASSSCFLGWKHLSGGKLCFQPDQRSTFCGFFFPKQLGFWQNFTLEHL